jgi:hypothetical protein
MIITRSKAKPKGKRDGRSDDEGESYGIRSVSACHQDRSGIGSNWAYCLGTEALFRHVVESLTLPIES